MTCQECQIELFEDTPGRDALVHVAECEDCRTLAREIRANAEALAALKGEELAARPFVHPRRLRPIWAVAAAAALILGLGLPRMFKSEVIVVPVVTPPVAVASVLPPAPAPEITKRTQPAPRRPKARPKAAAVLPVEEPAQPLLVKMLTPDPDVVIYWLIDPVEGENAI